jgi:hypothetical protein
MMRSLLGSSFIWGMLLLLTFNIWLWKEKPLTQVDPESLPAAHTWVWWAAQEFLEQKEPSDVVLLGSSLVMHPVSRLDADYLNKDLDYVHHHSSKYLADGLATTLKRNCVGAGLPRPNRGHVCDEGGVTPPLQCFNFALPGGMVSDDYIVYRSLFTNERKPKVIVLGLSLRDFIDNGVHCAAATPAFRYLNRFCNVDDIVDISMPQIFQRFDYWQGKAIYLWGKKLDLQVLLAESTKRLCGPFATQIFYPSALNSLDLTRNLPSNARAEVEEGMFIVKSHQPYSFEDNSSEYRKRYRQGNESLFANQTKFLERLLDLAKKDNVKVILVNMPLTKANLALMPPNYYQRYVQLLQNCSQKWQTGFVDLNAQDKFQVTDFYDTSHMNGDGGKKLVDSLIEAISNNQEIAFALQRKDPQGAQLAGHGHSL